MRPVLLLSVGNRGEAIVKRAQEIAEALCPRMMSVLRIISTSDDAANGAGDGTLRELAQQILDPAAVHQAGVAVGSPCEVILVADASEKDSQNILKVAERARQAIRDAVAGVETVLVLYLLVPRGFTDQGQAVQSALAAAVRSTSAVPPGVDLVYLVSGVSSTAAYTADDTAAMVAWTLAYRVAADCGDSLRALESDLASVGQRMATFGLSVLELFVDDIARRVGLDAARCIVSEGLMAPCDRTDRVNQVADEVAKDLELSPEGIQRLRVAFRQYVRGGQRRDVLDDLTIPPIAFERIPRRKWHILIGNYALYFRRERLEIAIHRVERNVRTKVAECIQRIRAATDSIVTSGRDPSNAFKLLEKLHAVATSAREALIQDLVAGHGKRQPPSRLKDLLPKLADAAAREPYLPAMILRAACAAAGLGVALVGLLTLGSVMPEETWGRAMMWASAFLIPFVVGAVTAWRCAQAAIARTNALRDECLRAIREEAVERINALVENGLDQLTGAALFLTGKPEELERLKTNYSGPNEWQLVAQFIQTIKDRLPKALATYSPADRPSWCIDIERYALKAPQYPYANEIGFNHWTDEAATLIANGLFNRWREADADAMARQVEEHAIGRMEYVRQKTLDDFFSDWIAKHAQTQETVQRIHNDTWNAAHPALQLIDTTGTASVALSATHHGNVEIAKNLSECAPAGCVQSSVSVATRRVLLRVLSGISPEKLAAWELWSEPAESKPTVASETEDAADE